MRAHQLLGFELGLLVGVVEALADVKIRFTEVTVVGAGDVRSGDVAIAVKSALLHRELRELDHAASALEVDLTGLLERQRKRHRRSAVHDRRDLAGQSAAALLSEAQPGRGELAGDGRHTTGVASRAQAEEIRQHAVDALASRVVVGCSHERVQVPVTAFQVARQHLHADEAGCTCDQYRALHGAPHCTTVAPQAEAGTERAEQHAVSDVEERFALTEGQRQRQRRRRGVSVLADVVHDAPWCQAESLGDRGEDPAVSAGGRQTDRCRRARAQRPPPPAAWPARAAQPPRETSRVRASSSARWRDRRRCGRHRLRRRPARPGRCGPADPSREHTAPAPSANTAAVERSSGSVIRDMKSAQITSAQSQRPDSICADADRQRRQKPGCRPRRCRTPPRARAPRPWATSGAELGITSSGVVVATSTRSDVRRRDAGTLERSEPASIACVASRSCGAAMRREWMPVRRTIHSSVDARSAAPISAFPTTVRGRLTATASIEAPRRLGGSTGSCERGSVLGVVTVTGVKLAQAWRDANDAASQTRQTGGYARTRVTRG